MNPNQKKVIYILTGIIFIVLVVKDVSHLYTKSKNVDANSVIVTDDSNIDTQKIDAENNASIIESGSDVAKASIASDGSFNVSSDIHRDYRFFGYEKPDSNSTKVILFSIFTNDVENNPFKLKHGAYYGTGSATDNLLLKYVDNEGDFVKISATDLRGKKTMIFFEKKWVEFETN